jgi:hypothetical protein
MAKGGYCRKIEKSHKEIPDLIYQEISNTIYQEISDTII